MIGKMPWYYDYLMLTDSIELFEKELEELNNPQKQYDKVERFYKNLGADALKNPWVDSEKDNLEKSTSQLDERGAYIRQEIKVGKTFKNAVETQTDESLQALVAYKQDPKYTELINQILFYVGINKVRTDSEYIDKAYQGLLHRYPLEKVVKFTEEGKYYYREYIDAIMDCLTKFESHMDYPVIKEKIQDKIINLRLMFGKCQENPYYEDSVNSLFELLASIEIR